MSNDKSGRNRLIEILTIIIILVGMFFGLIEFEPNNTTTNNDTDYSNSEVQENTSHSTEGELKLIMIDVGQADSFLLIQDGQTALIDCGTRSTGKDVVKYLKSLGITRLDYVFETHPHEDHAGGMYDVITNFEIGRIIIPEVKIGEVTSNWYIKLMTELMENSYNVEYAKLGEIYNLSGATIKIIGPISEPDDNINNYSTVLKVSFGEMDVIMTGDAEKEVEKEILESGENIDAEVLKIGHHGSDTSSTDEFLDAITPDYALISAELGNRYKHPVKSVMEKLEDRNIAVYRTDESGTVVVTITTDSISFDCDPGDYLSGTELEKRDAKWKVMLQ